MNISVSSLVRRLERELEAEKLKSAKLEIENTKLNAEAIRLHNKLLVESFTYKEEVNREAAAKQAEIISKLNL